ncbi:MAG TPA: Ku protein [Xanthobacteraceae bacterium]|nr:Ku protein [Xanthobacteraceae bacterium]
MPRASWSGFLRLSLVSCPIYLSPATTRAKPIRLHQVWRPAAAPEADDPDRDRDTQVTGSSTPWLVQPEATARADQGGAPTRIALRPHDPSTGEEIEKSQVVRGYEYDRGQFVTVSAEELKALDVESSQVIDLETFLPRGDIDPVYFDTPYYLYPDGPIAVEALRVIGAAMAEACVVGIGRLALSRRERIVMLEPRGSGMALFTLRAGDEVRAAQFGDNERDLDPEMVAIARAIIRQRLGKFDPSAYRDRYQEALRGLIEAKLKGVAIRPQAVSTPPPGIDLMAALKRSLAQEIPVTGSASARERRAKPTADRRQRALLLPVAGGGRRKAKPAIDPAAAAMRPRKKA